MSLLVIDVGNTNSVFGLFQGDRLLAHWRLQTVRERTADEYNLLVRQMLEFPAAGDSAAASKTSETGARLPSLPPVRGVIMASVVPPLRRALRQMCRDLFGREVIEVGPTTDTGMPIRYLNPAELGPDRIVNAVAARHRYGCPCIVADLGTASKYEAIGPDGDYLGGAIAPGPGISMEALFARAARLPRVDLAAPEEVIGRTTIESMQSGFLYGFAGGVKEMVSRFRAVLGLQTFVVATGGFAELIAPAAGCIDQVDPVLTLHGLRIIGDRVFGEDAPDSETESVEAHQTGGGFDPAPGRGAA